jgi:hypothetical protein
MMKYSIVLALILATSLNADINIKVEGDVVYSIDGKESKALTAKSGQEIKFISGNGVLKLSDDVLKQKFNLKAPNDTYVAAIEKKSGFFSTLFAKAQTTSTGASTRAEGGCEEINPQKDPLIISDHITKIEYRQDGKLYEFIVKDRNLTPELNLAPKNGDRIDMMDEEGYETPCFIVKM